MNYKQLCTVFLSAVLMTSAAAVPVQAQQDAENTDVITGEAAVYEIADETENTNAVTDASSFELPIEVQFCQTEARSELAMINELRTGEDAWYWNEDDSEKIVLNDLEELRYDYDLEKVAMQRAVEVAVYYSHTRPDGNKCWQTYSDLGYSWMAVGENIAAGYRTASAVFTGWAEENEAYSGQGHRRNMLSSDFKAVGCACVYYEGYYYWVQNFSGAVVNGTETPANDSTSIEKALVSSGNAKTWSLSPESLDILVQRPYVLSELITVNYVLAVTGWSPQARERKSAFVPDWKAEDETALKINNGVLTGLKSGTSKITALTPDGNTTLTETVNAECILVSAVSLTLKEKIEARFYVYVPEDEVDSTDIVTLFDGVETVTYAADIEPKTYNGLACRIVSVPTYARQMRDDIQVTVRVHGGTELKYLEYKEEDVTKGLHFKIEDYVAMADAGSDDAKLKDLVHKMDNYGKYAQIQFNYRTDTFDTAEPFPEDYDDTRLQQYEAVNEGELTGIEMAAVSLELVSDTGVRVYYKLTGKNTIDQYTFKVDGTAVTPVKKGNQYYVAFKDIPARFMHKQHTIKITGADGKTLTTKCSALTYASRVMASTATSDNLKNMCRAIDLYAEAALANFGED